MQTSVKNIGSIKPLNIKVDFISKILSKYKEGDFLYLLPSLYFPPIDDIDENDDFQSLIQSLLQYINIRNDNNYTTNLHKKTLMEEINYYFSVTNPSIEIRKIYETIKNLDEQKLTIVNNLNQDEAIKILEQININTRNNSEDNISLSEITVEESVLRTLEENYELVYKELEILKTENTNDKSLYLSTGFKSKESKITTANQTKNFINNIHGRVNLRDEFTYKQSIRKFNSLYNELTTEQKTVFLDIMELSNAQIINTKTMTKEEWLQFSKNIQPKLTLYTEYLQNTNFFNANVLEIENQTRKQLLSYLNEENGQNLKYLLEQLVYERDVNQNQIATTLIANIEKNIGIQEGTLFHKISQVEDTEILEEETRKNILEYISYLSENQWEDFSKTVISSFENKEIIATESTIANSVRRILETTSSETENQKRVEFLSYLNEEKGQNLQYFLNEITRDNRAEITNLVTNLEKWIGMEQGTLFHKVSKVEDNEILEEETRKNILEYISYLSENQWEDFSKTVMSSFANKNIYSEETTIANSVRRIFEKTSSETENQKRVELLSYLNEEKGQNLQYFLNEITRDNKTETTNLVTNLEKWIGIEQGTLFHKISQVEDTEILEEETRKNILEYISYLSENQWEDFSKTVMSSFANKNIYSEETTIANSVRRILETTENQTKTENQKRVEFLSYLNEEKGQNLQYFLNEITRDNKTETTNLVSNLEKWIGIEQGTLFHKVSQVEDNEILEEETRKNILEYISYLSENQWEDFSKTVMSSFANKEIIATESTIANSVRRILETTSSETENQKRVEFLSYLNEEKGQNLQYFLNEITRDNRAETTNLVTNLEKWIGIEEGTLFHKVSQLEDNEILEEETRKNILEYISYLSENQWEDFSKTVMSSFANKNIYSEETTIANSVRRILETTSSETENQKRVEFLSYLNEEKGQNLQYFLNEITRDNRAETTNLVTNLEKWIGIEQGTLFHKVSQLEDTEILEEETRKNILEYISYLSENQWEDFSKTVMSSFENKGISTTESTIANSVRRILETTENQTKIENQKRVELLSYLNEEKGQNLQYFLNKITRDNKEEATNLVTNLEKWIGIEEGTLFHKVSQVEDNEILEEETRKNILEYISYLSENQWEDFSKTVMSSFENKETSTTESTIANSVRRIFEKTSSETENQKRVEFLSYLNEEKGQNLQYFLNEITRDNRAETTNLVTDLEKWIGIEEGALYHKVSQVEDNEILEEETRKNILEYISYLSENQWEDFSKTVMSFFANKETFTTESTIANSVRRILETTENKTKTANQKRVELLSYLNEEKGQNLQYFLNEITRDNKTETTNLVTNLEKWIGIEQGTLFHKVSQVEDNEILEEETRKIILEYISYLSENQWEDFSKTVMSSFENKEIITTESTIANSVRRILETTSSETENQKRVELLSYLNEEKGQNLQYFLNEITRDNRAETTNLVTNLENWIGIEEGTLFHKVSQSNFVEMLDVKKRNTLQTLDEEILQKVSNYFMSLNHQDWESFTDTIQNNLINSVNTQSDSENLSNILTTKASINLLQKSQDVEDVIHQERRLIQVNERELIEEKQRLYNAVSSRLDIKKIVTEENEYYYTPARIVMAKTVEDRVKPMVQNTMEQARKDILEEINHTTRKNVIEDIQIKEVETKYSTTTETQEILKQLKTQQQQLKILEEEQKNTLKQSDISNINRIIERNLQTSIKLEKMRKGGL